MSKITHQSYTAEFRELAVKQAIELSKLVSDTAKALGVNSNILHYTHGAINTAAYRQKSQTDISNNGKYCYKQFACFFTFF